MLAIIESCVAGNLGEVAAHQREVMVFIHLPNGANTRHDVLVAQLATQRITGIRRVGYYTPGSNNGRRLPYQTQLGGNRVDGKELSHVSNTF